jgi:hypothetical protein
MNVTLHTADTSLEITAQVTCESCDHKYIIKHWAWGSSNPSLNQNIAKKKSINKLIKDISKLQARAAANDFEWLQPWTCPQCGYLQSWAVKATALNKQGMVYSIPVIAIIFLAASIYNFLRSPVGITAGLIWLLIGIIIVTGLTIVFIQSNNQLKKPRVSLALKPEITWPHIVIESDK